MQACPSGHSGGASISRRLAAIAFVDIAGYTILMARDETRTHQRWMTILHEVIRPQAEQFRGTVVKSTGDGVLVEFLSVHEAVEWARNVQRLALSSQTDPNGTAPSIALRISVHFADVITTEFDVFGDGVNVAARLQEHAEAGGVVLSEAAYDLVRGTLGTTAHDLGYRELKNLEKPVRVYALETEAQGVLVPTLPRQHTLPSIAVLPLQNLGGDPADDYFSDGIVEDITLSLAGLRELMVISRSSTLVYRGRQPDPREVGRVLGVRYVLSGTVRRSERLVRVSVELCDANTGASLWGEKAEVPPGELFEVQDRIVWRIVAGIAPNVRAAEMRAAMRKRPESFTAYDYTLRALHIIYSVEENTFLQARDYLNKAMEEDPNFAMPVAWAARWFGLYVGQGWSPNPDADRRTALELAAKAIQLDSDNVLALATLGYLRSFLLRDYDSALIYFERAIAACPNYSLAWLLSVPTLSYIGRGEQAIKHAQHALRLSPLDRSLFYYYGFLNLAHYASGDYEEAVKWGKMCVSENPRHTSALKYLAASLAALNQVDEARDVSARLMQREPGFRLGIFEHTIPGFRAPEMKERFKEHLRKAGLPD